MAEWHMIHDAATGRAISLTTVVAPLKPGEADADLGERKHPFNDGFMWDAATRALVVRPLVPTDLIDRLDDLDDHPAYANHRSAIADLPIPHQANMIAANRAMLITLLGTRRFRHVTDAETL